MGNNSTNNTFNAVKKSLSLPSRHPPPLGEFLLSIFFFSWPLVLS
jgi:hypothetical protein